jgi:hypothetical protein
MGYVVRGRKPHQWASSYVLEAILRGLSYPILFCSLSERSGYSFSNVSVDIDSISTRKESMLNLRKRKEYSKNLLYESFMAVVCFILPVLSKTRPIK